MAMRELILDSSHDITTTAYGDGQLCLSRFGDSDTALRAKQRVNCLLRTEEGEAFADAGYGVPWFSEILGLGTAHLDVATALIREKVEEMDCVEKVSKVKIEVPSGGRKLGGSVRFVACDGTNESGEF